MKTNQFIWILILLGFIVASNLVVNESVKDLPEQLDIEITEYYE